MTNKQTYYKYTRTMNGGWRKEAITQRVYPLKLGEFDLIILKNKYGNSWEILEVNTSIGLVTGHSQCYKTRKSIIEEAKKLLASKSQDQIQSALLYAREYAIKFSRMPLNQDVESLSDLLTQADIEEINSLYAKVA